MNKPHANPVSWYAVAMPVLESFAASGRPFEPWDLQAAGAPDPGSQTGWATLFRMASRSGVIQEAGWSSRTRRPGSHRNARQWHGSTNAKQSSPEPTAALNSST